jgi:dienelactone hydrolase
MLTNLTSASGTIMPRQRWKEEGKKVRFRCIALIAALLIGSAANAQLFGNGPELTSMATFTDGDFQFQSVKKPISWYLITMEGRRSIESAEKAWIPAQLLLPDDIKGRVPAMVLIHGTGGLYYRNGQKRGYFDYAEALAKNGIAVVVVDTHGGRGYGIMSNEGNRELSVHTFVADAYAALDMLRTHPKIDGDRIGIMGFSKGGLTALLATDERFGNVLSKDAATFKLHIPIYPGCQGFPESLRPTKAPVLMLLGEKDNFTGIKLCFGIERQLQEAGTPVHVVVYPGAYHSWDNRDTITPINDVSTEDCQYVLMDQGGQTYAESKPIRTVEEANAVWKRCTKPGVYYVGRNENAYRESIKAVLDAAKTTLGK